MSDSTDRVETKQPDQSKKTYTAPTLTEYGSVAKLTMVKGSTLNEPNPSGTLKRKCL